MYTTPRSQRYGTRGYTGTSRYLVPGTYSENKAGVRILLLVAGVMVVPFDAS